MNVISTRSLLTISLFFGAMALPNSMAYADDPLPSWNEGASKAALLKFVQQVTDRSGKHYVPPAERIAVFDNDGTLWSEQPMYFQLAFALDRIKAMAGEHPEWKNQQPFKGVLAGDLRTVLAGGKQALVQLIAATHTGMTAEEFERTVKDWIATARHPVTKLRYREMVYQPMLEVLAYLRANGFKTFIVSGGGIEFMRPWVEETYGIPPEQVIGSSIKTKYELRDGKPVIVRLPEIDFINDKAGKPVGIHKHIGRRPIAAFGNSDGDQQMLEWTTIGRSPSFGMIIHHTDAEREWAYDRDSHIGRLDQAWTDASDRGWIVVDMKKEWNRIYPLRTK